MEIKQFLKPDWRKIVLTIILTILLFFVLSFIIFTIQLLTSANVGISREAHCCGVNYEGPFLTYPNGTVVIIEGCEDYTREVCKELQQKVMAERSKFYLILLIPTVIFSYLISCLIVWIYDKRKK